MSFLTLSAVQCHALFVTQAQPEGTQKKSDRTTIIVEKSAPTPEASKGDDTTVVIQAEKVEKQDKTSSSDTVTNKKRGPLFHGARWLLKWGLTFFSVGLVVSFIRFVRTHYRTFNNQRPASIFGQGGYLALMYADLKKNKFTYFVSNWLILMAGWTVCLLLYKVVEWLWANVPYYTKKAFSLLSWMIASFFNIPYYVANLIDYYLYGSEQTSNKKVTGKGAVQKDETKKNGFRSKATSEEKKKERWSWTDWVGATAMIFVFVLTVLVAILVVASRRNTSERQVEEDLRVEEEEP